MELRPIYISKNVVSASEFKDDHHGFMVYAKEEVKRLLENIVLKLSHKRVKRSPRLEA